MFYFVRHAVAAALLALFTGVVQADGLPTDVWTSDVPAAWRTAQRLDRPMVVFVSMNNCGHCLRMARQTLRDGGVQAELSAGFVPLFIKVEDHRELIAELGVKTFPTTMVISPDSTVLDEITGYRPAAHVKQRLGAIRQAYRAPPAVVGSARRAVPPPR